jgi:gamma-glutamyl-gamma-aminobutyraldehyde dehydrogenase/4-guanidinobutyraldehyde dehydrogenase/NAD-dependent aldehyde dehydrogenase
MGSGAPDLLFYTEKVRQLDLKRDAFINGRFVRSLSGKTFDTISPIDGRVIASVAECDAADVDAAVKAARAAFDRGVWRNLAPAVRKATMLRWAELIEKNATELALLDVIDMGKPIGDALKVDMPGTITCFRWYAEAVDKLYDEIGPSDPGRIVMIMREPLGVVAAVVPWNFPMMMAAWKIAPAVVAGNSVVLKPAEQSPLSALRLAELAAEAGIPDGVFNVVPGFGPTAGQALGRHMDVDCIAFTGSSEVGKYFLKYSAESNMKSVNLECGGKSPHIIMADAPNIDAAATAAAWAVFFNQGEVCNAGTRLLVEESVKDQVLEKVISVGRNIKVGNPLDPATQMGAIVDHTQLDRVCSYIESGKVAGARLALGGKRLHVETGGFYVEPTVFDSVDNSMKIAQEEIFGPVLSTITFRDMDAAVRIANDTVYGLYAAVWTRDINKAFRVIRGVRAGAVNVNTYSGGDISTPFGGFKQSGFGRDKSLHALEKYTALKASCIVLS